MATLVLHARKRVSPRFRFVLALALLLTGAGTLVITPATGVNAVNDQWELACSESPSGTNNYLFGVAAQANDAVVAVGSKYISSEYKPLIERWEPVPPNGDPCFKEKPSPSVTLNSELHGVARIPTASMSARPFWAVGYQGASTRAAWNEEIGDWVLASDSQSLIEYSADGGQTWSIASSPNLTGTNILKGVAARSDDDAWAVGYYGNSGDLRTLILHWDGAAWDVVPSPNQYGAYNNYLYSVSIVAKDDIWAVGFSDHPSYDPPTHRNLILHWGPDGQWQEVTEPQPSQAWNNLFSTTGIAANQAHAVGSYLPNGSGSKDTQALVWNGSSWSWEPSPSPGSGADVFCGSAPVTSSYLWAVGSYESPQAQRTLTTRRVNGVWYHVASLNASADHNYLRGVAVVPGTSLCAGGNNWAVGYYADGGVVNTLAMRYYITPACDLTP